MCRFHVPPQDFYSSLDREYEMILRYVKHNVGLFQRKDRQRKNSVIGKFWQTRGNNAKWSNINRF